MSRTDIDLSAIQAFAITLAKKAGATIVAGSPLSGGLGGGFDEKKNTADLVTETDQATEKLVKEEIAAAYPDHRFIGEESWAAGEENQLTDEPTWIVDPYVQHTGVKVEDDTDKRDLTAGSMARPTLFMDCEFLLHTPSHSLRLED